MLSIKRNYGLVQLLKCHTAISVLALGICLKLHNSMHLLHSDIKKNNAFKVHINLVVGEVIYVVGS